MKEHFREMTEAVAAPVVIYNVVPWTYLSPELLVEIMEEVPGVIGVKQSAGDLKLLADLMATAPDGARIMSAVDALMYPSFALGAHGAIAAILTAAPRALVELWDAVAAGDHPAALDLHGRLLALWNAMLGDNLPATVKAALDCQGIAGGPASSADAGRILRPARSDCRRPGTPAAVKAGSRSRAVRPLEADVTLPVVRRVRLAYRPTPPARSPAVPGLPREQLPDAPVEEAHEVAVLRGSASPRSGPRANRRGEARRSACRAASMALSSGGK